MGTDKLKHEAENHNLFEMPLLNLQVWHQEAPGKEMKLPQKYVYGELRSEPIIEF